MLKQGFVEKILERPSQYRDRGGKPKPSFWAMQVDNIQYGTKNDRPPAKEGDYVEFEAIEDGKYWRADVASIRLVAAPASVASSSAVGNPPADNVKYEPPKPDGKSSYAKRQDEYETREERNARQAAITYQAARKDAQDQVALLLTAGVIDFGKAKGAQKMEIIDILVDDYTVRFFNETKLLAPKEHASPVEASYSEAVDAARKPARKPKAEPAAAEPAEESAEANPWGDD